ncbi:hypothetical protein XENOCAPTIV_026099, partial [Xenoophorus captivus]
AAFLLKQHKDGCASVCLCFQVTDGVVDVIVYPGTVDKSRNRGFAFVEYESHKAAAMARRTLIPGKMLQSVPVSVGSLHPSGLGRAREGRGRGGDAARPSPLRTYASSRLTPTRTHGVNPHRSKSKVQLRTSTAPLCRWRPTGSILRVPIRAVFNAAKVEEAEKIKTETTPHSFCCLKRSSDEVRNLMMDTTEETLHREFSRFKPGSVERVKKLTDYAFIHYRSRHDAIAAMSLMNGAQIDGAIVEVTLAKPAGIKDGSAAGRRYNPRGYLGNTATGGASDGRSLLRATPLQTRLGNPHYDRGGEDAIYIQW